MYPLILIYILLIKNISCFINNSIKQEYSLICKYNYNNCNDLHNIYRECGSILFEIWLFIDILLSIKYNYNEEQIYDQLYNKIASLEKCINMLIKNPSSLDHYEDNKKLYHYIDKIIIHQIIKYNEILYSQLNNCLTSIKIIMIKKNNSIFIV